MKTIGYVIAIFLFVLCGDAEAQLFQRQPVRSLLARISGVQATCSSSQVAISCSGQESFSVSQSCSGSSLSCLGGQPVLYATVSCSEPSGLLRRIAEEQPVRNAIKAIANPRCADGKCDTVTAPQSYTPLITIAEVPALAEPTPDPAPMASGSVNAFGVARFFKDRIQFKRDLLTACSRAEAKGDRPAGTTLALARHLRMNPSHLTDIMSDVKEDIEASAITDIDWDAWIDRLERLIPIILKLIDLFAMDVDTAIDVAMALTPAQVEFWLSA